MKKFILAVFFVFTFFSLSSAADLYHTVEEINYAEGSAAVEMQNIKASDKVTSELVSTSETITYRDSSGKKTLPDQHILAAGLDASVKKNVKTYNLPLSYGMPLNISGAAKEYVNFKLKLPYTIREVGDKDESGLGDINLSADYLAEFDNILLNSIFLIKFASGDYDDADVPLGTGSTDYGLAFNGEIFFDKFSLKAGIGYVLTGDYSDDGAKIKYGDEFIISAGGEYNITDYMFAGGELVYNVHQEDDFSLGGSDSKFAGLDTLDFIPSFTYLFRKYDLGITTKLVIPVSDSWNGGDGPDPEDPDRDIEFKLQMAKSF